MRQTQSFVMNVSISIYCVSERTHFTKLSSRAPHANIHTPGGTASFPEDIQATMLHLCGHFSTSEKAQWLTILLRSILGEAEASIFRLHTTVNP